MRIMLKRGEKIVQHLLENEAVNGLVQQMDSANKTPHEESDPQITSHHCKQTAAFAFEVAERFIGVNDDKLLLAVALGALLHDVGKSGVDIDDLHHPGLLTIDEKCFLYNHPEKGVTIVSEKISNNIIESIDGKQACGLAWGIWDIAKAIIASHHTKKAVNSYPDDDIIKNLIDNKFIDKDALKTVQDNKIDKIVAICDVYSALLANQPYTFESFETTNITGIVKEELGLTTPEDLAILSYLFSLGKPSKPHSYQLNKNLPHTKYSKLFINPKHI